MDEARSSSKVQEWLEVHDPSNIRPEFIPDGFLFFLDAVDEVGKCRLGDEWSGEEPWRHLIQLESDAQTGAPRALRSGSSIREITDTDHEALARKDDVLQWMRQRLWEGTITAYQMERTGELCESLKMFWANKRYIDVAGRHGKWDDMYANVLFLNEVELRQMLVRQNDNQDKEAGRNTSADEGQESRGMKVDPYHTGFAGRPTLKGQVLKEFERRVSAGEICPTLKAEAEFLHQWAATHYPHISSPKPGTIRNQIRVQYKQAKIGTK